MVQPDASHSRSRGSHQQSRGRRANQSKQDQSTRSYSKATPSERARKAEPARFAAYTLLRAVDDGAYANLEMPSILRRARLAQRDAAFATELGFGTIRWRGFYDPIIERAADRPTSRIDAGVLDVLRLGAHQLLGMRVAAHAAADQSVALARAVTGTGSAGFVNAVLRRISERTRDEWLREVVPLGGGTAAAAIEYSHPEWVVAALRGALLGHGRADARSINQELAPLLRVNNEPPTVNLVARPGLIRVEELVQAGARASALSPVGAEWAAGDPGGITAVRAGRAAVQDFGSQLVALAVAAASVRSESPERWLDMCAGPGGKVGLLAGLARQCGASIVANEVSEHRADLVRKTLQPAIELDGDRVQVRTGDGRELGALEPAAYTRVLVDAPCTGLGALRRRPEARWRRQPSDLAQLGPLQRELLGSALDAAAPGGVVVYATCSPHPAETTFVVADVLKRRDDVEHLDARELFSDARGEQISELGPGPAVQLWPHVHGTDAMYAAVLRKL